jgi:hypothetical protein
MATDYTGLPSSTTAPVTLSEIELSKLDFDDIKTSLKTYLKGQSLFTDYDFEGSALSILLDVLSYNTMYYSFYVNMVANEMFLDTVTKGDNAVSLAKMLGYVPKSKRCATATLQVGNSGGSDYYISLGDLVATSANTYWHCWTSGGVTLGSGATANINVYGTRQGGAIAAPVLNSLLIPHTDIDTTTLKVYVTESGSPVEYEKSSNIVSGLSGDDKIYFLDTAYDGYYRIRFGDGVFGKSVPSTSETRLQYVRGGYGPSDNNVNTFTNSLGSNMNILEVITSSRGGANPDSLEDIKFNAPAYFQSQNRAVTQLDYKALATQELRTISSISVWGGEDSNPPRYGRVFVSTTSPTEIDTSSIVNILKEKSVVSILPEYIAPVTNVLTFNNFVVDYDRFATNKSESELHTLVKGYMGANFKFGLLGYGLKYEEINTNITNLDTGIVGMSYFLTLTQLINTSDLKASGSYLFDFGQVAASPSGVRNSTGNIFYSSLFSHDDYPDDGQSFYIKNGADGQVDLYQQIVDGDDVIVAQGVGTYDSTKGFIYLRDVPATSAFTVTYEPKSLNVASKRNILFVRDSGWLDSTDSIVMEEI